MIDEDAIRYRWETVGRTLDERGRRLFAAAEVRSAGWGSLAVVSKITGLARSTINRGEDDLDAAPLPPGQVRRAGGGRKAASEKDPELVPTLQRLVEPATLGDPERPLLWVSKSMDKLAAALTAMGHPISADTVAKELVKLGFSRQYNRKADEGSHHPDRNAQFEHINAQVVAAQAACQPVISVDTKKKELVGNFKNGGSDYRPKGEPLRVNVHDFEDKTLGKENWRGRPLTDRLAVVELIGATTTKTGLKVECVLDERTYEKGIKVSDAEMRTLDITGDAFHPEWNYTIKPREP